MFKYNAKVERVVDGDTVDALVDLGSLHVGDINVNKVLVSEGHANEYFGGKR